MKIQRDGNTFTVQVDNGAHAETLDALLKVIALTIAGPGFGPAGDVHPVSGLTLSVDLKPFSRRKDSA